MMIVTDPRELIGKEIRIWCNRPSSHSPRSDSSVTVEGKVYFRKGKCYIPDPKGRLDYQVGVGRDIDIIS